MKWRERCARFDYIQSSENMTVIPFTTLQRPHRRMTYSGIAETLKQVRNDGGFCEWPVPSQECDCQRCQVHYQMKVRGYEWKCINSDAPQQDFSNQLFVGRLPKNLSSEEVENLLRKQLMGVEKVTLVLDQSGKSRGYAFISFETAEDRNFNVKKKITIGENEVILDEMRGKGKDENFLPRKCGGTLGLSLQTGIDEVLVGRNLVDSLNMKKYSQEILEDRWERQEQERDWKVRRKTAESDRNIVADRRPRGIDSGDRSDYFRAVGRNTARRMHF